MGIFYKEVQNNPSRRIKAAIVQEMMTNDEISEKVAEFLENGGDKLSKFYHLLKLPKMPPNIDDPSQWLEDRGFPIRGIISGRGAQLKDWQAL